MKDEVLEFYQLDDFPRLCHGKKDFACVSEWLKSSEAKAADLATPERALY